MKLVARLLLVFALLFAQAGGAAHEIWHASSLAADGDAKAPKGNPLCDFHTTLGSVSAALHCAHDSGFVFSEKNPFVAGDAALAPPLSLLAAQSRGPPALL